MIAEGIETITASYTNILIISFLGDDEWTNKGGITIPIAREAMVDKTPRAVTLGTRVGLNHVVANLEGELIIKIFPNAAKKDPISTGTIL